MNRTSRFVRYQAQVRSQARAIATLVLSLGLLAAGTAAVDPATASPAKTTSPMVGIYLQGGFVAPAWLQSRLPKLLLYPDGTALIEDPKPVHGYVRSARIARVSAATASSFAHSLLNLAKTPNGGWGFPGVADVPSTQIKVRIAGSSLNSTVYALDFNAGGNVSAPQAYARKRLSGAVNAFLKRLGNGSPYSPASYEVWGQGEAIASGSGCAGTGSCTGGMVGMANPASVYCASIGGTPGITDTAAGQAGTCQLPSGEVVDEWVNYRAALKTLPVWPSGYRVPSSPDPIAGNSCVAIGASKLRDQLANKDDGGRWLLPSGQAFPVVLRAVLPGETACHRSAR